jgi:SAM-dependent methyltransferase
VDWDERFRRALAERDALDPPATWLLERRDALAALAPGRAADVACGLGRHAVMLAQLGFEVDAIDQSEVALAHLAGLAFDGELPIRCKRLDLAALPALPRPPYSVIVMANYLQRDLLPSLIDALAVGGLLAVEAFLAHPAPEWGPSRASMVLAPNELERLLAPLDILSYDEVPDRGRVKARALARR